MPVKYAEHSTHLDNMHTELYVSVWNLQVLSRVQLTLCSSSWMHVPSKSSSLIG